MKALVTGSTGFIGSHLVPYLESMGDHVTGWGFKAGPDITDEAALRTALQDQSLDAVFHLAGQSNVHESWQNPATTFSVNAGGTLALLAALRETNPAARVLLMSSAEVYGKVAPTELPLTEDRLLTPSSPYGASKSAAEQLAVQAWHGFGQEVITGRAFNHIGPGQAPTFVTSAIAERIARNEQDGGTDVQIGNLSATRDFIDVRDAVVAHRQLILNGSPGEAYNICRGEETAVSTLANLLLEASTTTQSFVSDPARLRPSDVPRHFGSPDKIEKATGWVASTPLEHSTRDVLNDWRSIVTQERGTEEDLNQPNPQNAYREKDPT